MRLAAIAYKNAYSKDLKTTASGAPQLATNTTETVQDFLAYLYSVIRHDAAMVHVIDKALKDRYGAPTNTTTTTSTTTTTTTAA